METAKLLSTFATGLAAALTGVALQVDGSDGRETASIYAMAVAAVATVLAIALDRLREVDHEVLFIKRQTLKWHDDELLRNLRTAHIEVLAQNEGIVIAVRFAATFALIAALVSGALATASLM